MSDKTVRFWKSWSWVHYLALGVVLAISVKQVYERQVLRLAKLDKQQVEVIEEDIEEYHTMAGRLTQLEVLPPVKKQWDFVPAITAKYGVGLHVIGTNDGRNRSSKVGMYSGPLAAWNAEISGSVIPVLVAAREIQRTVPAYLYQISIKKGEAKIGISILGSE